METGQISFRKTKQCYLILFIVFFFNFGAVCHGADYFVDDDTCPSTGSGTSGDPFCSIQYAINEAVDGDTVYVHDGSYAEAVTMKTGVDLLNISGEQPTIVTSTADNLVLFDNVSNCSLDGFLLDDSDRTGSQGHEIVSVRGDTSPGNNLAIRNCVIRGSTSGPIIARAGIKLTGQLSIEITGNTITRHKNAGITTERTSPTDTIYNSTITLQGNIITENQSTGIYLLGSGTGNRIIIGGDAGAANSISNNGGIERGSGMWLKELQGVSIDNNEIFNNTRAGILLDNVNTVSPHIARNTIHDNFASGINIGGDSDLTIGTNNEIYGNAVAGITFFTAENTGLNIAASSGPVTISENTIHTNGSAGISVVDNVTGPLTIQGNSIYQNEKAGIAFLNNCVADITENDIHDHTGAAGIFTGTWSGGDSPSPSTLPTTLSFNRTNGPVELTINRNKIYNNLAGMRLDHASGTIGNNLIHHNARAGIRFSGNDISPYEPFGTSWGITHITNNTVADNGTVVAENERYGSGIYYDDINNVAGRDFFDPPEVNINQGPTFIQNNIAAYNARTGIRDAACTTTRDYNLYYFNNDKEFFVPAQILGCAVSEPPDWVGNPHEIFSDPLFVDRFEYRLQSGSPAKISGNDGLDMGAYGGTNPITW